MHLFSPKRLRNLLQVDFPSSVTQLKAPAIHQSQFDIYNAAVDFILSATWRAQAHLVIVFSSFQNSKSLNIPHCYIQAQEWLTRVVLWDLVLCLFLCLYSSVLLNFNTNLKEFFSFSLWSHVVEISSAASAKCESYQNQMGFKSIFSTLTVGLDSW